MHMNRTLISGFVIFFSILDPIQSHELSSFHNLCLRAEDYQGCMNTQARIKADSLFLKPQNWQSYGSLQINLSSLTKKDSSFIAPALNNNGRIFFIALNCSKSIINFTASDKKWKGWHDLKYDFEYKLFEDICSTVD